MGQASDKQHQTEHSRKPLDILETKQATWMAIVLWDAGDFSLRHTNISFTKLTPLGGKVYVYGSILQCG